MTTISADTENPGDPGLDKSLVERPLQIVGLRNLLPLTEKIDPY